MISYLTNTKIKSILYLKNKRGFMNVLLPSKNFLNTVFKIGLPLIIQFVLTSILNFIDVIMVGQLGEAEIAGVGIGNQIVYIFILCSLGIATGAGIFAAQFWGANDLKSLHKYQGLALTVNLSFSLVFMAVMMIFPNNIIRFFTNDTAVIDYACTYLFCIIPTFLTMSISFTYAQILITTRQVKYALYANASGVIINTILNYCLIFGNFGFPQLGVTGAAIATLIARIGQVVIILAFTYGKKLSPSAKFSELKWNKEIFKKYFKIAAPVFFQNILWVIGVSVYSMIYGHISTHSFAAYNVASSIEKIALMFFTAFAQTCAILVGNSIGANNEGDTRKYAKSFIILVVEAAFLAFLIFIFGRPLFMLLYKLTDESLLYINNILFVLSFLVFLKAINIIFYVGIFRGGGDTKFCMLLDNGGVWLIGIPLGYLAAFVLKLPIHFVILFISMEELIKFIVGLIRFKSGKWVHNLVKN